VETVKILHISAEILEKIENCLEFKGFSQKLYCHQEAFGVM